MEREFSQEFSSVLMVVLLVVHGKRISYVLGLGMPCKVVQFNTLQVLLGA